MHGHEPMVTTFNKLLRLLEGTPMAGKLDAVNNGTEVKAILESDLGAESTSVPSHNAAVVQAQQVRDSGTRQLLEDIPEDEDHHLHLAGGPARSGGTDGVRNDLLMSVVDAFWLRGRQADHMNAFDPSKLVRNSTPKILARAPHGIADPHHDRRKADLLGFLQG